MAYPGGAVLASKVHRRQMKSVRLKEFTKYGTDILEDLDFSRFIQEKNQNVSVNWDDGTIKGAEESIKQLVKEFETNIVKQDIAISGKPGIQRLLYDPNGSQNDNVLIYIEGKLKKNNVASFHLEWKKNGRENGDMQGSIYCHTSKEAADAKSIIEGSFHSFRAGDFSDDVKQTIISWEEKKKIVEGLDSSGKLWYTCTEDVNRAVQEASDKIIERIFPIHQQVSQFLSEHESIQRTVLDQNNVELTIDHDNNTLKVAGRYLNVKKAIFDIMKEIPVDTVPFPIGLAISKTERFDKIAREHQCSLIYPNIDDQHESGTLGQCDYIMSWFDPTKDGKFTVIEGDTFDLDVDCLIVLCTDSLFPLQLKPDEEMLNTQTKYLRDARGKKAIGSVVYEKVGTKHYKNVTLLVVGPSNPTNEKTDILQKLSSAFEDILKEAERNKWRTICFPAFIEKGYHGSTFIVKEFLEAVIGFQERNTSLQIYLYLEKEKIMQTKKLLKSIHERYKKEVGFFRKEFRLGLLCWKDRTKNINPKIEVKIEPIEKANTNIIVNTTTRTLVLNKGGVSQRLLKLAGEDMQKECKEKYPNGIDYTQVAVTSPHKLLNTNRSVAHIFHGALPKFERNSYVQNLKCFVWRCLAEAQRRASKSVAFPSLGTGSLGYPGRESAKALFDAVEEYGMEVVNPYVQRVVFSLHYDDTDICKVFQAEQKRRIASRPVKMKYHGEPYIEPTKYRKLKGLIFARLPHPVEVIIAPDKYIGPLSSNVVEIGFFPSEEQEVTWKYCDVNPETYNDRLLVSGGRLQPKKAFETVVKNAINYCLDNRIAEIGFGFSGGDASVNEEKDVNTILAKLQECLGSRKSQGDEVIVLHTVYIRIVDIHLFEALEKSLMSKPLFSSLFSSVPSMEWQVLDSSSIDKTVQVKIIGESLENVQTVKKLMQDEAVEIGSFDMLKEPIPEADDSGTDIDSIYNAQGARPKILNNAQGARPKLKEVSVSTADRFKRQKSTDSNMDTKVISGSDDDDDVEDDDMSDDDDDDEKYLQFPNKVSAEINNGFIAFKKEHDDLQHWISLAEETFKVRIELNRDDKTRVHGTYRNLMQFKTYLDKKFPSNPRPSKRSRDSDENTLKSSPGDDINNTMALDKDHGACSDTKSISLSGGELDSCLFMATHSFENVKSMQYNKEISKLVICYQGTQQDKKKIQKAHKNFLRQMSFIELKLENEDEISRAQTALEQVEREKVLCQFFPQEDSIHVCAVDTRSAKDAEDSILRSVGRTKPFKK